MDSSNPSTQFDITNSSLSPSPKKQREVRRGGDKKSLSKTDWLLLFFSVIIRCGKPLKEPQHVESSAFCSFEDKRIQKKKKKRRKKNQKITSLANCFSRRLIILEGKSLGKREFI